MFKFFGKCLDFSGNIIFFGVFLEIPTPNFTIFSKIVRFSTFGVHKSKNAENSQYSKHMLYTRRTQDTLTIHRHAKRKWGRRPKGAAAATKKMVRSCGSSRNRTEKMKIA